MSLLSIQEADGGDHSVPEEEYTKKMCEEVYGDMSDEKDIDFYNIAEKELEDKDNDSKVEQEMIDLFHQELSESDKVYLE